MTISVSTNRVQYTADGLQKDFPYTFKVLQESHLHVYIGDIKQTTGFTITGIGSETGGNVEFDIAPVADATVTLHRVVPIDQLIDYVDYDPFPAETHELGLDKLTMICQQLDDELNRTLTSGPTTPEDQIPIFNIGPVDERGNKVLTMSTDGTEIRAETEVGNWRGDWMPSTGYNARDLFVDAPTQNLYVVHTDHVSGTSWSQNSDKVDLLVDVAFITQKANEAAASAAAAAASEDGAEDWAEDSYGWGNSPEDVLYTPNDPNKPDPIYSAYHWFKKTEALAVTGVDVRYGDLLTNTDLAAFNTFDWTGDQYAGDGTANQPVTSFVIPANSIVKFVRGDEIFEWVGPRVLGGDNFVSVGLGGSHTAVEEDFKLVSSSAAANITYDNTIAAPEDQLAATNVQDAIDEIIAQDPPPTMIISDVDEDPNNVDYVAGQQWFDSRVGEQYTLYDDGDSKQWVNPAAGAHISPESHPQAFMGGAKNKIINGAFDIWQRGTSFPDSGSAFTADRYRTWSINQQVDTSQVANTAGEFEEPYHAKFNVVTVASGAGDYVQVDQRIEDVRTLQGKKATISFWAKTASPKDISLELVQSFGDAGSSNVFTFAGKVSLTSTWAKYEATVDVPSVAGKTIGANSFISLRFWLSAGTDFDARSGSLGLQTIDLDITRIQIEEGEQATEFEKRHIQQELALCQRYYQTSGDQPRSVFNGDTTNGIGRFIVHTLLQPMRIAPTLVLTNIVATNFPTSPGSTNRKTTHSFQENRVANATANNSYYATAWTADAEL